MSLIMIPTAFQMRIIEALDDAEYLEYESLLQLIPSMMPSGRMLLMRYTYPTPATPVKMRISRRVRFIGWIKRKLRWLRRKL